MNITKLRGITLFILLSGLFCIFSLPVAAQGTFRVTVNSFRVNQQTNEGLRASDGADDEAKFISHVGTLDAAGAFNFGEISGSQINNLATNPGGIQTMPTLSLFSGEIGLNTRAVSIIPTIWEMDDLSNLMLQNSYRNDIRTSQRSLTSELASILRNRPPMELGKFLLSGSATGINLSTMPRLAGGIPQDRPIGMMTTGLNQFGFSPQVLVLTFDSADFMSRTDFGNGVGVVPVRYVDAAGMGGDYTLFLKVERTDQASSCPGMSDFTSTFTGRATLTISNTSKPMPRVFEQEISFPVEFTNCRTVMRIANFTPITPPEYDTAVGRNTTTVNQASGGTGGFNLGTGRVEISITLGFLNTNRAVGNSTLPLELTTDGGKKDPNTGVLTLVGEGAFSGGYLGSSGSRGSITVTGSFSPRPR